MLASVHKRACWPDSDLPRSSRELHFSFILKSFRRALRPASVFYRLRGRPQPRCSHDFSQGGGHAHKVAARVRRPHHHRAIPSVPLMLAVQTDLARSRHRGHAASSALQACSLCALRTAHKSIARSACWHARRWHVNSASAWRAYSASLIGALNSALSSAAGRYSPSLCKMQMLPCRTRCLAACAKACAVAPTLACCTYARYSNPIGAAQVETKNGELYRGELYEAEDNWNCQLRAVQMTSRVRRYPAGLLLAAALMSGT